MNAPDNLPEFERWAKKAEHLADRCDDLPDRCEKKDGWQESLRLTARGVRIFQNVTPDQMRAVENIEGGIAKWLRD